MKNLHFVLYALMLFVVTTFYTNAQQNDELERTIQQKVQEEYNATVDIYKQADTTPALTGNYWQIAEQIQTTAAQYVQTGIQFADDVAELNRIIWVIFNNSETLESRINHFVKNEQLNEQENYIKDSYIENLTKGTCLEAAWLIANPAAACKEGTKPVSVSNAKSL